MTLARKIAQQLLKDELRPEKIKTVIELTKFLKFMETQKRWSEIKGSEAEYLTDAEAAHLEEVKAKGEFISQEEILKELGIR